MERFARVGGLGLPVGALVLGALNRAGLPAAIIFSAMSAFGVCAPNLECPGMGAKRTCCFAATNAGGSITLMSYPICKVNA